MKPVIRSRFATISCARPVINKRMSMKKLGAVIAHWYDERTQNLQKVVEALYTSSMRPDEILIWDNTAKLNPDYFPHCHILRSPWNIGCKSKFLAALTTRCEYIFMTDNDITVQTQALEHMMSFANRRVLLTLEGHVLGPDKSYRTSTEPRWNTVTELTYVDTLNCRTDLIHRDTLKYLLQDIPFDDSEQSLHEDFYLAAACHKHDIVTFVVPGAPGQGFDRLPEHGVGMSVIGNNRKQSHYDMREALCKELF